MGGRGSGRRSNYPSWELPDGPFPCFFECGRMLQSKRITREFTGWEWFTGYGERPLHFCPDCRRTRAKDVAAIREHMNRRPEGYPAVRVEAPAPEQSPKVP